MWPLRAVAFLLAFGFALVILKAMSFIMKDWLAIRARDRWNRHSPERYPPLTASQQASLYSRSEQRLLELLPPGVRDETHRAAEIRVKGKRREWALGYNGSVCSRSLKRGAPWVRLCVHPIVATNGIDKLLTMLLWVKTDEDKLIHTANFAGYA